MAKANTSRKVVAATRGAVVNAARRAQILKQKTVKLARDVEKKWEASKPAQKKAKAQIEKAARRMITFGKDVQEGIREGIAEVQKKSKRRA